MNVKTLPQANARPEHAVEAADSGDLAARRRVEIEFWRDDPDERPGAESIWNQVDKQADALILLRALERLGLPAGEAVRVLELGAGQGWASCVVKRLWPEAQVMASDISEYAVASAGRWESIYGVALDDRLTCPSDALPIPDGSVDFAFCFAAAHHFVTHEQTLRELARVLSPDGVAAYLYEPTTPRFFYRWAYRRVNAKRPHVPEDVIVPAAMRRAARAAGLTCEVDYWPATLKRARRAALYYAVLATVPGLKVCLPCTANFIFRPVRGGGAS